MDSILKNQQTLFGTTPLSRGSISTRSFKSLQQVGPAVSIQSVQNRRSTFVQMSAAPNSGLPGDMNQDSLGKQSTSRIPEGGNRAVNMMAGDFKKDKLTDTSNLYTQKASKQQYTGKGMDVIDNVLDMKNRTTEVVMNAETEQYEEVLPSDIDISQGVYEDFEDIGEKVEKEYREKDIEGWKKMLIKRKEMREQQQKKIKKILYKKGKEIQVRREKFQEVVEEKREERKDKRKERRVRAKSNYQDYLAKKNEFIEKKNKFLKQRNNKVKSFIEEQINDFTEFNEQLFDLIISEEKEQKEHLEDFEKNMEHEASQEDFDSAIDNPSVTYLEDKTIMFKGKNYKSQSDLYSSEEWKAYMKTFDSPSPPPPDNSLKVPKDEDEDFDYKITKGERGDLDLIDNYMDER